MTKCIVLGETKMEEQKKKPIEFIKRLDAVISNSDDKRIYDTTNTPLHFKYIELVCPRRENYQEYDIMFAYDDSSERGKGVLFLGNWNDGVAE